MSQNRVKLFKSRFRNGMAATPSPEKTDSASVSNKNHEERGAK